MDVGLPETTVSICREARKKDRTVQRRSRIDEATEGTWVRNNGAGLTADLSNKDQMERGTDMLACAHSGLLVTPKVCLALELVPCIS